MCGVFQVGLPLWIVELRHDATHRSFPSLELLRTAADFALNFLKVYFSVFYSYVMLVSGLSFQPCNLVLCLLLKHTKTSLNVAGLNICSLIFVVPFYVTL